MADLVKELGKMNFGRDFGDALAEIGKTLGENARKQFIDKQVRDIFSNLHSPEDIYTPENMSRLTSLSNMPEGKNVEGAIGLGESLYNSLANIQTRREIERDRRYASALQNFRAHSSEYIKAQESKDIDTQRESYDALQDDIKEIHAAYPERSVGLNIPKPVGYGPKYFAELDKVTASAKKLREDSGMKDLKDYAQIKRNFSSTDTALDKEIEKANDTILKASKAQSDKAALEQLFPGAKSEELPNIISEAKQMISTAKSQKESNLNAYRELETKYQSLQGKRKTETTKRYTQLRTDISEEDKSALDFVQEPKNESHKNYQKWVDYLKKKGIIKGE